MSGKFGWRNVLLLIRSRRRKRVERSRIEDLDLRVWRVGRGIRFREGEGKEDEIEKTDNQ